MMGRVCLLLSVLAAVGGAYLYATRTTPGPTSSSDSSPQEIAIATGPPTLSDADRLAHEIVASLSVFPGGGYPADLPWAAVQQLGVRDALALDKLLRDQPLVFLEKCLERYERDVDGYTLTMLKRERIGGKLYPPSGYEKVHAYFREHPFSVLMNWQENARLAQKVLYVHGENNGKMLVRPTGLLLGALVVTRDVDGPDAKEAGHYTPNQFGLFLAMKRSVDSMRNAQARGTLHVKYDGIVTLHEIGDRPCYKFVRTPYEPHEEEGLNELTLYVDTETWLQVGSTLRDGKGELIGEYFFRDLELNPSFRRDQFKRGAI